MKIAIIAEYNPFHNGHIYQLKEAKKKWPNDEIIVIMSGKYVQRGELAVAPFEQRANMAKQFGASEVYELPFEYATQAAHIFAHGAVKVAYQKGARVLFFGSESNDSNRLMLIAKTIKENEQKYNQTLKSFLKMGYSFPKACAQALSNLIGAPITMPNDILGLEYCKAIVNNGYDMEVKTLKRTIDFHSEVTNQEFASASYIRHLILEGKDYSKFTPMKFESIPERIEDHYHEFQKIVNEKSAEELSKIHLISEGMENLFKKHIDAPSYEAFVERTNSRRYTSSRIKRVMLYVLLQIYKKE